MIYVSCRISLLPLARSLDIETRYDRYLSYRIYKWRMQIRAVWL